MSDNKQDVKKIMPMGKPAQETKKSGCGCGCTETKKESKALWGDDVSPQHFLQKKYYWRHWNA